MTNKEAIRILERLQEPEAWEPQLSKDAYTALEMAIKAMEKQIPKEPKYKAVDKFVKNRFITITLCPGCGREIVAGDMHCIRCGQAVNWTEDES